jgi:hypothetical protein
LWREEKARGAHRKPLAEVILWSTPLRATSSVLTFSKRYAVRKPLKIRVEKDAGAVGIARL